MTDDENSRLAKTNEGICFVIMPFSETAEDHTEEYWTDHYEKFLKPLIEECGDLKVHRSEPSRGDIPKQIINDLYFSEIVVVNLTDQNPNVYWELGVRHSYKHGTIMIAENGTSLPFDISAQYAHFYYPDDYMKDAAFRNEFKGAIYDCLEHPDRPDSPVLEALSGRGTLFEMFFREQTKRRLEALKEECDWNLKHWGLVVKAAHDMVESQKYGWDYPSRLGHCSLELLITDRYIDEDKSFFKSAEDLLIWIISVNNILGTWFFSRGDVERRIIESEEKIYNRIKDFMLKLESLIGLYE